MTTKDEPPEPNSTGIEDTNVCRVCFGPIAYRQTIGGAWLPLDCAPTEDGTVRVRGDRAVVLSGADLTEARRIRPIPLFKLHKPTEGCPK
ncbi:hypothetical protein [Nocardia salmonicida]|uniref:hypothetical protein n=1 Tax=Nocardia salmonicida TaxID=53431 RepID=UPI002E2DE7F1|nr:hypothetical protein [Nocardia salmonicida]